MCVTKSINYSVVQQNGSQYLGGRLIFFCNLLIKAVFVWLLSNFYDKGGGLQESRFNLESSIKIEEMEMLKSLDSTQRGESKIIGWGTSKSEV